MNLSHEATTKSVAKINDVTIMVIENGEKRVPVKPICDALGIDFNGQFQRIQRDEILNSVAFMTKATGKDKKQYEMLTIPFQFVFGWLFTIQTDRVKPEVKESLIKFKLECHNALWRHFTAYQEYVEFRQDRIEEQVVQVQKIRKDFHEARVKLKDQEQELNEWLDYDFEKFIADKAQQKINFDESAQEIGE